MHIEIVPKLDTDNCLIAIMRFIAQRGKPSTIISDNGTNFVGAEREFAEYVGAWNKEGIEEHLIQLGIRLKFKPPAAPHFGGVCERLVRSCKKAMFTVLGSRSVNEDVLSTTMFIVEQTLNARPLTLVSSDVNDLEALTPPITSCLATGTSAYTTYRVQKNMLIIENSFDKLKPMQISYGTDFVKNICQL